MQWSDLVGETKYEGAIIQNDAFGQLLRAIVKKIYILDEKRIKIIPMGGRILKFNDETQQWHFAPSTYSGWAFSPNRASLPILDEDVIKFEVSDLGKFTIYPVGVKVPYR
jgi:hypothetical protein